MKKGFITCICILSVVFTLVPITTVQAQREYILLAPLPIGEGGTQTEQTNFAGYINGMYQFALGVAGILAVIMIIFAGFTYMTTDAFQKKQDGKERIKNAILGLLLAIATWLILNTINPGLLEFELKIERPIVSVPPQPTTRGGGEDPENILDKSQWSTDEAAARALLEQNNLQAKGACKEGAYTGCVNLAGLPQPVFTKLQQLEQDCKCQVYITGGTEGAGIVHKTHGENEPVVDLDDDPALINHIITGRDPIRQTSIGALYQIGNTQYLLENDHVHACIGTPCRVQ